ncbi:MAG: hypothetical protein IJG85_01250 [Eubacteriaceae bacterium]|nr:hypothetical protein [Eubacteriaceae bacterium]
MKMNNPKLTRRLFCLALMLGLMLGLGNTAMAQEIGSWDALKTAMTSQDTNLTLTLTSNIDSDAPLTIPTGKTVTLDLAGHNLNRGLSASEPQVNGHVIEVTGGTLTLKDSSSGGAGQITGGSSKDNDAETVYRGAGGVLVSSGTFNMEGGTIIGNTFTKTGTDNYGAGGVLVCNGTFNMSGGSIADNTNTGSHGGGVCSYSTFTMIDGTISGNTATGDGGGINASGTFSMTGGSITENHADNGEGGGVYVGAPDASITGGTITNNTAKNGAGVSVHVACNMTNCTISDNTATGEGGGVWSNSSLTLSSNTIQKNEAYNGGGAYISSGLCTMSGDTITGNQSTYDGGGVYAIGAFTMESGTISNNTATGIGLGGGVYTNGVFTMSSGTISANTGGYGGGVNVGSGGKFTLSNGTISGNTATYKGGGVFVSNTVDTQFTMNGGTIQNNTAASHGGGIYAEKAIILGGTPTITGNTVNSRANNVFLSNSVHDDKKINIVSALTPPSDKPIGITLDVPSKDITTGAGYADDAAAQAVFTSDDPRYEVTKTNANQAALQAAHYNLWVGDDEVTGERLSGNGWSFDPWTNTLTLDGLSYSGTGHGGTTKNRDYPLYACIFYDGANPLNLVIEGTNTVRNTKTNIQGLYSCGIYSTKDMTISGSGQLTTSSQDHHIEYGIWCFNASLTINDGTVNSGSSTGSYGIFATNGVTINNGTVRASGDRGIAGGDGQKLTIANDAVSVVITGRGTATDLSVANAVKGYGWTNKEGTQGQTEIDVNTNGQSLSTYKKLEFPTNTYTVTFKVTGGAWNDGTTADQLVTVKGDAQTAPTLTDADIPAVGARPSSGYITGSWRPSTPTAGTKITKDTTYTYAYTPKNKITRTVTFKVEHGAWDDGTTEDQTVTLEGYEGDTLKLKEEQIPAVGNKPDKGYQAGSWDTEPSPDTPVTENTTYTYTYDEKPIIIPTLYFAAHVENKGWDQANTVLAPGQSVTVGTTGRALRVEALAVMVPEDFRVIGFAHVQNVGDAAVKEVTTSEDYTIPEGYKAYEFGSTGKARRLEAICVGILDDAGNYVPGFQYAAHVQNAGWQGYVRNGSFAGTRGMALRMEALRLTYADPDVVPPEKIN